MGKVYRKAFTKLKDEMLKFCIHLRFQEEQRSQEPKWERSKTVHNSTTWVKLEVSTTNESIEFISLAISIVGAIVY
jgi:hypothetical protein